MWGRGLVALVLAATVVGFALPAAAQDGRWVRAETPHFVIYSDAPEPNVREAAITLERFDAVLRRLAPPPRESPAKLEIYLLRRRDMLRRVAPDLPSGAAGFYSAYPEIVAAFAVFRSRGGLEAQEVLFHEYAHHYMLHNFTQAYPGWYIEGFAEVVMTAEFQDDGALVGRYSENRADWLGLAQWLPVERVLASHRQRFTPDESALFYAQSWLMAHYFMLNPENGPPLGAYLSAVQQGADTVEAFEPAFGQAPTAFQRTLRNYTRNMPLYRVAAPASAVAEPRITRLSPAADRLLILDARLRLEFGGEADAEFLQQVESDAREFPNDAYAQRVLARAMIVRGAYAEARALLEPLADAESTDVEAHYLMGLSYMMEVENAGAEQCAETARQSRRHFARAFRLDALHVATQYRYVSSWQCDADMPDATLDVLLNVYGLAPQVSEIRLNAAAALLNRRRFEEAAAMLRTLVYAPHRDAETDTTLAQLLAAAERGEQPAAPLSTQKD